MGVFTCDDGDFAFAFLHALAELLGEEVVKVLVETFLDSIGAGNDVLEVYIFCVDTLVWG